jgi:hypothetical protein
MKLRYRTVIGGALAALVFSGSCLAQVSFSDIKVGTMLDGKGIELGAFIKPLPLPPGDWEVVTRINTVIELRGGRSKSTPNVSLTLKSTNKGNSVIAMVVDFTPDSSRVNWGSANCKDNKARIVEDFETDATTPTFACGLGRLFSAGLKDFFGKAPQSTEEWPKSHLSDLARYVEEIPDAFTLVSLDVNRLGGRRLSYTFFATNAPNQAAGDPYEDTVRDWVKVAGKAVIVFLGNDTSSIPVFPSALPAAVLSPAS